jgi:hypothetical protein
LLYQLKYPFNDNPSFEHTPPRPLCLPDNSSSKQPKDSPSSEEPFNDFAPIKLSFGSVFIVEISYNSQGGVNDSFRVSISDKVNQKIPLAFYVKTFSKSGKPVPNTRHTYKAATPLSAFSSTIWPSINNNISDQQGILSAKIAAGKILSFLDPFIYSILDNLEVGPSVQYLFNPNSLFSFYIMTSQIQDYQDSNSTTSSSLSKHKPSSPKHPNKFTRHSIHS